MSKQEEKTEETNQSNISELSKKPQPVQEELLSSEEQFDKQFFAQNKIDPKSLKLNKGEKRALKFLIQKQTGQTNLDMASILKSNDIQELRNMLAKHAKETN